MKQEYKWSRIYPNLSGDIFSIGTKDFMNYEITKISDQNKTKSIISGERVNYCDIDASKTKIYGDKIFTLVGTTNEAFVILDFNVPGKRVEA